MSTFCWAEGRRDLVDLLLGQLQRQGAGLDLGGDGGGTLGGLHTVDHTGAVGDSALYGRVDQHFAVQIDGDVFADIGSGHIREDLGAFVGQGESDLMIAVGVVVGGGFDHIAGHERFAGGILELQLGGGADQVEHGVILHIRDLNTDPVRADALHIGFVETFIAQTGADDGHGAFHQFIKVGGGAFRRLAGIFHIHTAPQIKTQGQGSGPIGGSPRREPGQNLVQAPRRNAQPCEADHAERDRQDKHHTQRDNGTCFATGAPIAGFHGDRFLLLQNTDEDIIAT